MLHLLRLDSVEGSRNFLHNIYDLIHFNTIQHEHHTTAYTTNNVYKYLYKAYRVPHAVHPGSVFR
jgi:hypothetical protein